MQAAETINSTMTLNGDHIIAAARQRGLMRRDNPEAAAKPSGKISIVEEQAA